MVNNVDFGQDNIDFIVINFNPFRKYSVSLVLYCTLSKLTPGAGTLWLARKTISKKEVFFNDYVNNRHYAKSLQSGKISSFFGHFYKRGTG